MGRLWAKAPPTPHEPLLTIDHLWAVSALILAPFVGSFIGLLTLRLPADRPWAMSRSACDTCKRRLGVVDLVPLVSFLVQRGRCRTCGTAIPRRYPLLEGGCLVIALWSVLAFTGGMILLTALMGWSLLLIATIDTEHLWLPDRLTLPFGALGVIATLAIGEVPVWTPLVGAAVGFGGLALIAWLYKTVRGFDGMGGGDPRLLGAIGAWVGWQGLPSVLVWACVAGLSVAIAQTLVRRRFSGDQQLPFGAFLAIGAWLTWLWGPLHALLT
ncbi:prepilin peptidase [Caulobacter vibrioides]|nr:prepilin peptidase [Caulobacter vibrioides]AZH11409.1 prepilin peptidase [Caulobacter vibrioides]PLR13127.1 prepilin peptidase [Caulobacter vibrioides]